MVLSTNLGFPRIGENRELKHVVESYWSGQIDEDILDQAGWELQRRHWQLQHKAGISLIPSNDFSYYDQVLDTAVLVGAIPDRYGWTGGPVPIDTYFAMARGQDGENGGVIAMEMTKWFDTNYHYIVPELLPDQQFTLADDKPIRAFKEAQKLGITTKPVLLGPLTFLKLSKPAGHPFDPLTLLERLLPVYEELLIQLHAVGAKWVQLDEPALVLDLSDEERQAYSLAYQKLARSVPDIKIMVATYFGPLKENLQTALGLPIDCLHLDLTRGTEDLDRALSLGVPERLALSLGLVNGRNIWITDLRTQLQVVERAKRGLGSDRVFVAPSCSLLHVPVDLTNETKLDDELRSWVAFAVQKLDEVTLLAAAANEGVEKFATEFAQNDRAIANREASTRIHRPEVSDRLNAISDKDTRRTSEYPQRASKQYSHLQLPLLPTTTIGSFPQTSEVRQARAQVRSGKITEETYDSLISGWIRDAIRRQEEIGLDVLVHGEFERNDMVEYFGELLEGFAVTSSGWVQSYGTRCVKPPIIFGDVFRPEPMTVKWSTFAQGLTDKPVKGMLTGPVTILQWSFVRDDQPRDVTCKQIALALRDEVQDLESSGIGIIQVDEPALREGLPLRRDEWPKYLDWAVQSFRLATSGVKDETQIHTHMCYSEFNDIIDAIVQLDADVISIEASRSDMELLDSFVDFDYPNEIGPGVYDIHSPRVPTVDEIATLLEKVLQVIEARKLWVNPDCGLKTRGWDEVTESLTNLVQAAQQVRDQVREHAV